MNSIRGSNNNRVIDDESAVLNGTLNAMHVKEQENYNSNISYK